MRLIWMFLPISISACSASPLAPDQIDPEKSFIGPNGGPAYMMACDWGQAKCFKRAREICPSGYTIFDSISDSTADFPFHYIAYECKPSPPR